MTGLVDLHCHLLPGIDDGPEDLEQALALARAAADCGISTLATTPHLRADFPAVRIEEIADRCQAMRAAIGREGIALELVCGAEVSLAWALEAGVDELRLASFAQRGSDLLIESPLSGGAGIEAALYEIRVRGYRVILAHPERSPIFHSHPEHLVDVVREGVLLQVNANSLSRGRRTSPETRLAVRLCAEGLAHVIASDGHRAHSWRPVGELGNAVELARALVGSARARWLTSDSPAAILAGAPLPEAPAIEGRSRAHRLSWSRRRRNAQ